MTRRLPTLLALILFTATVAQASRLDDLREKLKKEPEQPAAQPAQQKPEEPKADSRLSLLHVTEEDEIHIGQEVSANLLGAAPLVQNEAVQRYINTVGRWVALQSERPRLPWHFGVIESSDINAFAAPGGYIFLTKGLYQRLQTEAELAGVLAHEVTHVIERHHIELMRKGSMLSAGTSALQKKLGGGEKKDKYLKSLMGNGAEIFARGLDKDAEFEADRKGVVLAARAGYDPYGLPGVLQTLGTLNPADAGLALLYKTHPRPGDRLERLGNAMGDRLNAYEGNQGGKLVALQP